MRICVIGAAGRTGLATLRRVEADGHEAIGVARHLPSADDVQQQWRRADVLDLASLRESLRGAEAVISCVGIGSSRAETEVYSRGVANLQEVMAAQGAGRLVVVSASPAGPKDHHHGFEHRIVMPVLEMVYGASYRDMRRMESVLAAGTVEWVALRPPRLLDRGGCGAYQISEKPVPGRRSLAVDDLAHALVDCAVGSVPSGAYYVS